MSYNLDIMGWMYESELRVIETLAKQVAPNGRIVEVGSFMGRSSYCWAESAHPTVEVLCIDIFYENYCVPHNIDEETCKKYNFPLSNYKYNLRQEFIKNVGHIPNITMITGNSPEIDYDGKPIDIFFLDASHTNPNDWDNIEFFLPYIKNGGLLCGHDYGKEFPDILDNINKLETILNVSVKLYQGTRIWTIKVERS